MIEQEVSISSLTAFFPATPKRKSETWSIPTGAVENVSGRAPDPDGFELTGTLENVTKMPHGERSIASPRSMSRANSMSKASRVRSTPESSSLFVPQVWRFPAAGARRARPRS